MDVSLTELERLEVTRVDAVTHPANGFPVLLLKGVTVAKGSRDCPKCSKNYDADHTGSKCENCGADLPDKPAAKAADDAVDCPTCKGDGKIMGNKRDCPDCGAKGKVSPAKAKTLAAKAIVKAVVGRKVDESPDIAGGTAVISQIADLIIAECQEIKAGQTGEIADVQQLACAAEMIWCWRTGEESVASGSVMPATALMQSAAKAALAEAAVYKDRNYSAAERKEMAADGRALPDGSYPINDEHDLNSAAILQRSGHGDTDAAAKHIGKRARELKLPNPLEQHDDTSKSRLAEQETAVDTVTQDGQIAKAVEDAIAKATAPLQERLAALDAELAKVKAQPVHGGPVMTAMPRAQAAGGEDWAAKAKRIRDTADSISDPATADGYRQWARQIEAEAKTS